jgi:coenzyme F420-reducing hydrogenase beta subunit/polysaccharide pyruvyl transferase WcaK-like protein
MEYSGGQFLPKVDEARCTGCTRCARVCPGLELKGPEAFGADDRYAELDGPCLACYTAHVLDPAIRAASTSGGVVTALLDSMLTSGEYDYAFVLPFDSFKGVPARLEKTSDPAVVRAASGSKYVPASALEVVKALGEEPGASYVVVATPCVIEGIKRFMESKGLADTNVAFFGLFCDRTMSFNFLEHFERKYARPGETLSRLDYRTKDAAGWPGNMRLIFSSGRELRLPRAERTRLKSYFQLERCLYCADKLARLSDISFGDCYIRGQEDARGLSSVIVRTPKGQELFKRHGGSLCLQSAPLEAVRGSQGLASRVRNIVNATLFAGREKELRGLGRLERRLAAGRLNSSMKKIELGRVMGPGTVERSLTVSRAAGVARKAALLGALALAVLLESLRSLYPGRKSGRLPFRAAGRYVVIVGGGLGNKGAQAMTFVAVDRVKKRLPGCRVCLLTSADYPLMSGEGPYAFDILPWSRQVKAALLAPRSAALEQAGVMDRESRTAVEAVERAALILDVSGFALSSDVRVKNSAEYLLNIIIASRHGIPFIALPQSFGPFDYPLKYRVVLEPLLRVFLRYPYRLFARERRSAEHLSKYTTANVFTGNDIVLEAGGVDPANVYRDLPARRDITVEPGSAGVVPSLRVLQRTDPERLLSLYRILIERLLASERVVYIIRHSHEDLELCRRVKALFPDSPEVRLLAEDLTSFEIEDVIKRLDLVIASRYHSIVHAYRNGVPALILGWAEKYGELARGFNQEAYLFDASAGIDEAGAVAGLERLLENIEGEREAIRLEMRAMAGASVFDVLGPEHASAAGAEESEDS